MSQPLDIAFLTDGEPFHGASPEEGGLGGSETAMVQVARAIQRRGHHVTVVCNCPRPGDYNGVVYLDRKSLIDLAPRRRFDVVVISRYTAALDLPLQTGLKVLWNHDILDRPRELARRVASVDLALVLSRFHADDFMHKVPEIKDKLAISRNGLDLELIDAATRGVKRDPSLVTYVSRPERGLYLLLKDIWPRLKARLPQLRLALCGYQVREELVSSGLRRRYQEIADLVSSRDGVINLGSLAKPDYYRHLASCGALLYPCVFPEISCIAALEAQAVATPILTSDGFALSETVVSDAMKVAGEPGSSDYVNNFLAQAAAMLTDPASLQDEIDRARGVIRARHSWSAIAQEWEGLFIEQLEGRRSQEALALAATMVLNGDRTAAVAVAGRDSLAQANAEPPQDRDEAALGRELALLLAEACPDLPPSPRVGIIAGQGRGGDWLPPGIDIADLIDFSSDSPEPESTYDLVLVRDLIERDAQPHRILGQASAWCKPGGRVVAMVARGAWPLLEPGYLDRTHDLDLDSLKQMLPGRPVDGRFLPRGLIRAGGETFYAGWWLMAFPAQGPPPVPLDYGNAWRKARPAPPEVLAEVKRAGIL